MLPPLSIDVAKISHRFSEVRKKEWVLRGRLHTVIGSSSWKHVNAPGFGNDSWRVD